MPCAQFPDPNSADTKLRDLLQHKWLCCLILQVERCHIREGNSLFQPDVNGQPQTGTAAPYHAHQVQQVLLHHYPWCRVLSLAGNLIELCELRPGLFTAQHEVFAEDDTG